MTGFRYLDRTVVALRNPALAETAVPRAPRRRRVSSEAQRAVLERIAEWRRSKPTCPAGHEYAGANLYVTPDGKHRRCRRCRNAQAARIRLAKRLQARL